MAGSINMIVVGECGDGKSTLINSLRDPAQSVEPLCGKSPQGVTKDVVLYRCPELDGKPFNLIDTPGVGDGTVTPARLIALIEEFLKGGTVPGGIQGVIVTNPIPDCRIKLGAQVVQIIVDKGFLAPAGEDKYANIILTGTKADRADEEEKANFMRGSHGHSSVRELFFKQAVPPGRGSAVMVHKMDYSPLLKAIKDLPMVSILYRAPEAKVVATALAKKLGTKVEAWEEQLSSMRKEMARQSIEIQRLQLKLVRREAHARWQQKVHEKHLCHLQLQATQERQNHVEEMRRMSRKHAEAMRRISGP